MDLASPSSLIFAIALFPGWALVLLVVFGAYLGITKSFSPGGFLSGLLAAFLVLSLGNVGVIVFLVLQPLTSFSMT
jgi:hypothetical protein